MITLAAVHLLIVIIYHFSYNVCGDSGEMTRNRIVSSVFSVARWFTKLLNKKWDYREQVLDLPANALCNIPEVTFNYRDFQEPLIGLDSTL